MRCPPPPSHAQSQRTGHAPPTPSRALDLRYPSQVDAAVNRALTTPATLAPSAPGAASSAPPTPSLSAAEGEATRRGEPMPLDASTTSSSAPSSSDGDDDEEEDSVDGEGGTTPGGGGGKAAAAKKGGGKAKRGAREEAAAAGAAATGGAVQRQAVFELVRPCAGGGIWRVK